MVERKSQKRYNVFGEDITKETIGSIPLDDQGEEEDNPQEEEEDNPQEDIIEEVPEAFIPSFTVAPDEIPIENQVRAPDEQEQKAALDGLYDKLGLKKAKEFLSQPVQELTPESEKTLGRVSMMAARIFSSVSMWGYSVLGTEYGIVAPTVQHSYNMIHPIGRIVARHSKFVGNISPDVDDAIESLTAMSDYAVYAMAIMSEIREDKARNNGRYTGAGQYRATAFQDNASNAGSRYNDIRENTNSNTQYPQDGRFAESVPDGNLTEREQYNRDMLRTLAQRDYDYRARRSGKL